MEKSYFFFKISQTSSEKCFSHGGYYIESRGNRAFFGLFWGLSRAQFSNLPARNLSGRKPGTRPRVTYTPKMNNINALKILTANPEPGNPEPRAEFGPEFPAPETPKPGTPEPGNPGPGI